MHLVKVGDKPHRLTHAARGGGVDPPTNLDPVDDKVDHGLHTHRLDNVQPRIEGGCTGRYVSAPFDDVLWT